MPGGVEKLQDKSGIVYAHCDLGIRGKLSAVESVAPRMIREK